MSDSSQATPALENSLGGHARVGGGTDSVSSPTSVGRPPRARASWRERFEITILSGPALIVFVAFVFVPVAAAVYYGFFYGWKGYGHPTDFAWFRNYKVILTDPEFHRAVLHNFEIAGLSLLIQGPLAILLALLLNREMKGRTLIRVLVFVPWVVSEVIAGTGLSLMLPVNGAINGLLTSMRIFGNVQVEWLGPHLALWTLMAILTWKYLGFATILLMAGLQNIPEELYEAAAIDGASYWQMQRSITLPLLGPTIRIWAFLSIIGAMQLFDLPWIVWGEFNVDRDGVSTMATYMAHYGPRTELYGYGNAVAVVLFLISLIVALFYQRFVLRRDISGSVTDGGKR